MANGSNRGGVQGDRMRKERLIVPILAALVVAWVVAQLLSSILFERSLRQALED